ncbi:hypothetical protein G7Y79_00018g045560 [Physcia stellaris]|nr:hypothetical protein G7Y79_00018g045560 [Physcia stellaris]
MLWSPHAYRDDGGYQAYRFHKRYYTITITYTMLSSGLGSVQNLGTWFISRIPSSHPEYLSWLAAQRSQLSEREKLWEEHLAVQPSAFESRNPMAPRAHREEDGAPRWFIPSHVDWVFIVDLDRQVLDVGDGLQFALEELPHIDWAGIIEVRRMAAKVGLLHELFPGMGGEAALPLKDQKEQLGVSRYEKKQLENSVMYEYRDPARRIVTPKSLADIPWRRRHGPILHLLLFSVWSNYIKTPLATTLPQWDAEDAPFQEIAFTILCLAAGGKHVQALNTASSTRTLFGYDRVHALVSCEGDHERQPEAMSLAMSGSCLADGLPAFPAGQMIYWFDNVLVVLTTRLDGSRAVDDGVDRVVGYCRENCPASCVDAVLMSIQHVVLIRLLANGGVQHSALLPLFDITESLSSELEDCYQSPGLEPQLSDDDSDAEEMLITESHDSSLAHEPSVQTYRFRVKGKDKSTFCAITHILDAAARRRMSPLARGREGVFPTEIYIQILAYVTDPETRASCLDVCRTFRDYCQEHLLLSANTTLQSSKDVEACTQPGHIPKHGFTLCYRLVNQATRTFQVDFESLRVDERSEDPFDERLPSWTVAVGAGRGRRILLRDLQFRFTQNPHCVRESLGDMRHLVARRQGGDNHYCIVPGCDAEILDPSNLRCHYRNAHMYGDAPTQRNKGRWLSVERARELGLGDFDSRKGAK